METVQAGWRFVVGGYPFFVSIDQAPQAFWNCEAQVLPHSPAWMAGLSLIEGRAVAVIDLGRFMGLARAAKGPWLQPDARLGRAWVLQIQDLSRVTGTVRFSDGAASPPLDASIGASPSPLREEGSPQATLGGAAVRIEGLAARVRPHFSVGCASWMGPDGQVVQADVLNLEKLLEHPRIREFQA